MSNPRLSVEGHFNIAAETRLGNLIHQAAEVRASDFEWARI
jgi:hypothetical protein